MAFIIGFILLLAVVATVNKFFAKGSTDCVALATQGHYRCEHGGTHQ